MLTLAYGLGRHHHKRAALAAISAARRSQKPLRFLFLTADFSRLSPDYRPLVGETVSTLGDELRGILPGSEVVYRDLSEEAASFFPNGFLEKERRSPYPYLRYLLAEIKEEGPLLFLDDDVLAVSDVNGFTELDLGGCSLALPYFKEGKKPLLDTGVFYLPDVKKATPILEEGLRELRGGKKEFRDRKDFTAAHLKDVHVLPSPCDRLAYPREGDVLKHFSSSSTYRFYLPKGIRPLDRLLVEKLLRIDLFKDDYLLLDLYLKKEKERQALLYRELDGKYIIQVKHLYKSYGDLKAVDNVSFNVKRGSLFAFLGANGAGKSTTINIISSILNKDYGTVIVDGHDLDKERALVKKEIGIVFQSGVLDDVLTARENLVSRASFYAMGRMQIKASIERLSRLLDLAPLLDRPVKKLSGGQRRRLDIARSMLHQPKILILDEPTTGLDPKTRKDVWRLIDEIRGKTGMTVFLTTHYLEEAEQATDVVIMDHGKIIARGTPTELKNRYSHDYVIAYHERSPEMDAFMEEHRGFYHEDSLSYRFPVDDSPSAYRLLEEGKSLFDDFEVKKGDMDDVFLTVTGEKFASGKEDGNE